MDASPEFLLRPSSNLRPPSWRWQLALRVRTRTSPADRGAYDEYVRLACDIQEANTGTDAAAVGEEIERLGPAADAYVFWLSGCTAASTKTTLLDEMPIFGPLCPQALAVAELEALVLANKTPEFIAKRTGLTADAVRYYEGIWFDVRDRLKYKGWIAANVIGTLHQGTIGTLLPAIIRAYGYHTKKAQLVSTAVCGFDSKLSREAAANPQTFFAADAASAGGLKAALALRLMPLHERRTYARVVELHQEALRITADAAAAAGSDDENKLRAAVADFTANVKFNYGKAPPEPLRLNPHEHDEVAG